MSTRWDCVASFSWARTWQPLRCDEQFTSNTLDQKQGKHCLFLSISNILSYRKPSIEKERGISPKFLNAGLHFKPIRGGVSDLEAELLGTGVHRGCLSHSRRPSDEHGVAKWSPSMALSLSLAPKISTVPHICTPITSKQLVFRDFFIQSMLIYKT